MPRGGLSNLELRVYRQGLRVGLAISVGTGLLTLFCLMVWMVLGLAGDSAGAVVARVCATLTGAICFSTCLTLVCLLSRLQLKMLDAESSGPP